MNDSKQTFHKFFASGLDPERCAICKNYKPNHVCEICGLSFTTIKVLNEETNLIEDKNKELELTMSDRILMCHDCYDNENALSKVNSDIQTELSTTDNLSDNMTDRELSMFRWTCSICNMVMNGGVPNCLGRDCKGIRPEQLTELSTLAGLALQSSRNIDQSITVRTDLFNAETTAIIDLKKMIDENVEITNKPYALATELKKRFEHFQSVIFAKQNEIVEASNSQRAIQVYLNELANKLRIEERDKLKIADINYKPQVKEVKVPKIKVNKPKLDKELLNATAKELGIPVFTLQSFVIAKNISIEVAANMIKQSLGKS